MICRAPWPPRTGPIIATSEIGSVRWAGVTCREGDKIGNKVLGWIGSNVIGKNMSVHIDTRTKPRKGLLEKAGPIRRGGLGGDYFDISKTLFFSILNDSYNRF